MNFWGYQEMPPASAAKYKRPQESSIKTYSSPITTHAEEHAKKARVPKAKKPPVPGGRELARKKIIENAMKKTRARIDVLFANGPLTVKQIFEIEQGRSISNINSRLCYWKNQGLVKVVGTTGTAAAPQKIWDKA